MCLLVLQLVVFMLCLNYCLICRINFRESVGSQWHKADRGNFSLGEGANLGFEDNIVGASQK